MRPAGSLVTSQEICSSPGTLPAPRLFLDRLSARQGDTAMVSCLVPLDAPMTRIVFCKDGKEISVQPKGGNTIVYDSPYTVSKESAGAFSCLYQLKDDNNQENNSLPSDPWDLHVDGSLAASQEICSSPGTLPAPRLFLDRLSAHQGDTAMLLCLVPLDTPMTRIIFCKDGKEISVQPKEGNKLVYDSPYTVSRESAGTFSCRYQLSTRRTILSPVTPGTCMWMVVMALEGTHRLKRGKLQVTMQSSSAQVTMMESQNRKRAPAWTEREVRDLIAVWGEESVLSELRSSFRNAKTFVKISQGMKDRGHNRDPKQCRVKLKELRQAYQKTREANSRSGSEPQTCRFYDELHAILGGSATTTPAVLFDSFNGDGGNTEAGFGDEEDEEEEEVVDSSQQASGETGFPDSQELFLTLDLEPVPPEPTQGCLLDPAGGEGTSAACVSMITGSSPSQRLVKLRKKKKRTRDEMFSELMLSSHTDRAQTNAWRQIMSECRKAQNDREERWRAEESKWRAEDRAEAQMWRQRDERRQDSMLRLLQDQTSMLQCMVELQQRQLEHRLPLLPLCNQPPSSPSSIASTPRRPRTRWGASGQPATPQQRIAQKKEGCHSINF
ncbi:unnamed protein product, partial [Lepidochelys olivacea]